MKVAPYPIWLFIYLLFFGIGIYLYIISIQSWRRSRIAVPSWNKNSLGKSRLQFVGPKANRDVDDLSLGNFTLDVPLDLAKKIIHHKMQVITELRRAMLEWKTFQTNYDVPYRQLSRQTAKTATDFLCSFKASVKLKTIVESDFPFVDPSLRVLLQQRNLFEGKRFHTCAVVSSSGSLYKSNLGNEIDNHDIVLRFNDAPTEGFSDDVGNKTSIRIVNSQVVSQPEFNFLQSDMWRNVTLIAWDPSLYGTPLKEWYQRPDFDLFTPYFERRRIDPEQSFYLLNPNSLWSLWDFLQQHTPVRILGNPPSSGFLGLAILLHYCSHVDMYEYIPSLRLTPTCHYYGEQEDLGCTYGQWHPLAAEKLLALAMNTASDYDVYVKGVLQVPGLETVNC